MRAAGRAPAAMLSSQLPTSGRPSDVARASSLNRCVAGDLVSVTQISAKRGLASGFDRSAIPACVTPDGATPGSTMSSAGSGPMTSCPNRNVTVNGVVSCGAAANTAATIARATGLDVGRKREESGRGSTSSLERNGRWFVTRDGCRTDDPLRMLARTPTIFATRAPRDLNKSTCDRISISVFESSADYRSM